MKQLAYLFILFCCTQCSISKTEKTGLKSAASTALAAFNWGDALVHNEMPASLEELAKLYRSEALWADKKLKVKLRLVGRKLHKYNASKATKRDLDNVLTICDGYLPFSRGLSNVSKPVVEEKNKTWTVSISAIRTFTVQWRVISMSVIYIFEIAEKGGDYFVSDVTIIEPSFQRHLSQWLDEIAQ